ncbi:peptidoglycan-binding domain-containing protein [Thiohalobacter sp. IOR34]|uniref:peptidoglycan-binding domain-containing protein n=1 Tax=Thiohalobacter sp. IOR34 TaxID=3057176 RepID=UPI0025B144C2|nr:peptidoglycan-binding domain-containing protein [Thiohalobacter sp. IOR34]WJW74700.1 peptidoglycan-binding domain-containing protein [Thiohalobacter sp. IOR34]
MADDEDKVKKGFSGLSDLVSQVSGIDEPTSSESKAEANTSTPNQVSSLQQETPSSESERKEPTSSPPIETVSSGKGGGSAGGKWILAIIGFAFVVWLINNGGQSSKKPSYTRPSPSLSYNYPQSNPAPVVKTPRKPVTPRLQYTKPSVGTNNILSVPEIRWCVRESIRIEAMRNVINTNKGIDAFNRIVNDYNRRCGSYRYRRGSQQRAERDVEVYRSQIVAEAIREARNLGRSYQIKRPSLQYTREAQQLLTDLGYNPGPVDGKYGPRTANAVKAFQRDIGIKQDGWIDQSLINALRRAKAVYIPKRMTPSAPQSQSRQSFQTSTSSMNSIAAARYFTRGSVQDEVLAIQGKPSDIDIYSGTETWWYGTSKVEISRSSRRVVSWDNNGNLKVRYLPGSNTTSASYYTRGSHQDDVLRLQGTPSDIDIYSGTETWWYGTSKVEISRSSRRVVSWDNNGNLKVRYLPGSNTTSASYYTRGSHQDDVLRLQGTPSDIDIYSGTETWWYGTSKVEISRSSRRVVSWDNNGNLKVRYLPGSNTTSASYYTRGSHQDDVLRLQGTPSDIDIYSGTETWWYGTSKVEISRSSRRVVSWDNNGNLKVR